MAYAYNYNYHDKCLILSMSSNEYLLSRYVREWLGIMVTSGIVDIDGHQYSLPKHRIAALTNPEEYSVDCSGIPMMYAVEEELYNCFQIDGPMGK